jgi:hypothetical protein
MKATMITLAAVLSLFANVVLAGNDLIDTPSPSSFNRSAIVTLTPIIPAEATFEDEAVIAAFACFVPVVPSEATFEETVSDTVNVKAFAPVLMAEADFE